MRIIILFVQLLSTVLAQRWPCWPTEFKWSYTGKVDGYDCTQINEPLMPLHYFWYDNHFCVKSGPGLKQVGMKFKNSGKCLWVDSFTVNLIYHEKLTFLKIYTSNSFSTNVSKSHNQKNSIQGPILTCVVSKWMNLQIRTPGTTTTYVYLKTPHTIFLGRMPVARRTNTASSGTSLLRINTHGMITFFVTTNTVRVSLEDQEIRHTAAAEDSLVVVCS